MLGYLLKIERTKLSKRLIFWIEMALLCGLFLLYYVGGVVTSSRPGVPLSASTNPSLIPIVTWPGALIDILRLVSGNNLGGVVLMILVSVVAAQEYQFNTITLWLSRGARRPLVLAARCLILLLAALLLIIVPLVVGGVVTAILTMLLKGSLDLSMINLGQLALGVARTLLTALPYFAFTFMMATLTRSVAGGMGSGIGFLFVSEGVLPPLLQALGGAKASAYLPGMLATSLMQLNMGIANVPGTALQSANAGQAFTLANPTTAAVGLVLYAVVFLGIAFYQFQRQDISA